MTATESRKPVVLIFKEDLLPLSETFIEAQTRHLSRFEPLYVGLGEAPRSLPVPENAILLTRGQSRLADLRQKLYRRLGVAPGFHRQATAVGAGLLHAHFASGGRSALPLARSLRIPLVVTLHGSDVTTRIDFRARYAALWEYASGFICVSQFIREKAIEAGFPKHKLLVHYIGIDRALFEPRPAAQRRDIVLFVGRLVEKKGCRFFLEAMAEVQKHLPGVESVILGDGPLRAELMERAKQLGVRSKFLGAQPATVVREWLSTARVFCAPSVTAQNGDSEGLGMVFAEAQAMGAPVVSFHHGGIPEVVLQEQTGLLAPEGDAAALAAHLRRMLEDRTFWEQCMAEGPAWIARQFDLSVQTKELEQIYMRFATLRGALTPESRESAALAAR